MADVCLYACDLTTYIIHLATNLDVFRSTIYGYYHKYCRLDCCTLTYQRAVNSAHLLCNFRYYNKYCHDDRYDFQYLFTSKYYFI